MLHGWTGDERSMEIFARGLPPDSLVFFPRGPFQSPGGGFGWVDPSVAATLEALDQPVEAMLREVDTRVKEISGLHRPVLRVAGFSQGAAAAYALLLRRPERINRLAALAGFLPTLPASFEFPDLKDLPVYLAHGRKDPTVSIELARYASQRLREAGAAVDFCENEAGHKLPANCFSALSRFLTA
jgi:phospholipase/carboxylesterase